VGIDIGQNIPTADPRHIPTMILVTVFIVLSKTEYILKGFSHLLYVNDEHRPSMPPNPAQLLVKIRVDRR